VPARQSWARPAYAQLRLQVVDATEAGRLAPAGDVAVAVVVAMGRVLAVAVAVVGTAIAAVAVAALQDSE
jgi:hypothetical protein